MATYQLYRPGDPLAADDDSGPVAFKVADSFAEREAAFRLVYAAYTRAGLIEQNPFQMRVTPYQLLDTTDMFVAVQAGEVISTVSLVSDGEIGLPMEAIYDHEVEKLRSAGVRFAEVSSLADRRRHLSRSLPLFVQLMRLMVQSARQQGIRQLLVAVHPRHSRFYKRFLSFEPLGDEKSYPLVRNNPAVALLLDFDKLDRVRPVNYETFFGAPLPAEQLRRCPISLEERTIFGPAAAYGIGFTPIGPSDEAMAPGGSAVA